MLCSLILIAFMILESQNVPTGKIRNFIEIIRNKIRMAREPPPMESAKNLDECALNKIQEIEYDKTEYFSDLHTEFLNFYRKIFILISERVKSRLGKVLIPIRPYCFLLFFRFFNF